MEQIRSTCSLCEASCGALMDVENGEIRRVRPDPDDPLARGFICAKGAAIPDLERDPDRLHTPLIRKGGALEPVGWDEAFAYIDERLQAIRAEHGNNAVGVYFGNGTAHSLTPQVYAQDFIVALGTTNIFTSGTIDQVPRQMVSGLIYGSIVSVPVPDLDRCQLLWILGANPAESNGSLTTAPGFLGRLHAIKARGGRFVVFDPQETTTARHASEHFAIRPSSDAAFLAAVANVILREGPAPSQVLELCGDLAGIEAMLAPFTPEAVAAACDIPAEMIVQLALELRDTPAAALYGRMGTTTQQFPSLVVWLMDLVNILAGNLDVVGGAMFTNPLFAQSNTVGKPRYGVGTSVGRWTSRVRGAREVMGELPVACLPEEIETAGDGQIRGLVVIGANPSLSNPNARQINGALAKLDLLVCYDIYVNETGRQAHVILPAPPRLAKCNYDKYFFQWAVRNYARYTPAYRRPLAHECSESEIYLRLISIARGEGSKADVRALDDRLIEAQVAQLIADPGSCLFGRDEKAIVAELNRIDGAERRLDLGIRTGPHGDAFGAREGLRFESLLAAPSGLDLGPLTPRMPDILRTVSGEIELMQDFLQPDFAKLKQWIDMEKPRYVLVGRRNIRSNNSWFHNLRKLSHAKRQCTLLLHPDDACDLGISDGATARVSTHIGSLEVPVEITSHIARGVVSLPHGWGHESLRGIQSVSSTEPGVNVNCLTDADQCDALTGTSQVNGYGVDIVAV